MAIALVDSGADQTDSLKGGTGATVVLNTTGATLLVAMVTANDNQETPTDSGGNVWVPVPSTGVSSTIFSQLYYVKNPVGTGAGHSFNADNSSRAVAMAVAAFSGTDTTANADQSAAANNTNADAGTSITPITDNQLIVTANAGTDTNTKAAPTMTGQTYILTNSLGFVGGTAYSVSMAYSIQTTAVGTRPVWTYGATGVDHVNVASFKEGGGGGGAVVKDIICMGFIPVPR